jgi:hypothetical protein
MPISLRIVAKPFKPGADKMMGNPMGDTNNSLTKIHGIECRLLPFQAFCFGVMIQSLHRMILSRTWYHAPGEARQWCLLGNERAPLPADFSSLSSMQWFPPLAAADRWNAAMSSTYH